MNVQITHGLPEAYRTQAAQLYWLAFGGKLGLLMGPRPRALLYLQRVMQLDQCFAALQDGVLVGILGYHRPNASFAGGAANDLRAVYGALGGRWRMQLMLRVGLDAPQSALMIDGFSIAPHLQSTGIGAALLAQLFTFAHSKGFKAVHLDVASSNHNAHAYYLRRGFVQIGTRNMGPLRWIFGFGAVQRMARAI